MDKSIIAILMVLIAVELICIIRQENINIELRQQTTLQRVQIEDLSKRQRLTAQDVKIIEKIMIEGNIEK